MRLNCNMWQVLFNTHMLKYCKTSVNEVLWGEERSNKDKFLPQGSIEHHKKQKTTRWTVAADCSEHWLEPIQRIQSQGQRRHQSCMILLCLGRSAERPSWGYLKSRNHRKNLLRFKDNFKKIEERTRKPKKDKDCVSPLWYELTERRSRLAVLKRPVSSWAYWLQMA